MPHQAYKIETDVGPGGKLELVVPLPQGTRVEILVLTPDTDQAGDLVTAAASTIEFWDNPEDDRDWNDA